jgi:hypothetical protein
MLHFPWCVVFAGIDFAGSPHPSAGITLIGQCTAASRMNNNEAWPESHSL